MNTICALFGVSAGFRLWLIAAPFSAESRSTRWELSGLALE